MLLTVVAAHPAVAKDIRGTARHDVLIGTAHDDVIHARGSDDDVRGKGGDDRLKGGPGHDVMSGARGDDKIISGTGNDSVAPGGGRDVVRLGSGADRVVLVPDNDPDTVDCGDGEDLVSQVMAADPADTFIHCERFERVLRATPDETATAAGSVLALAAAEERTIVGGKFSRLGTRARLNVGALLPDGTADPDFRADTDGKVKAVATSPDGSTAYIGGTFTSVNGVPRANLAAVDARTGAVLTDWSADTGGRVPTVHSLAVHGDRLYVAGRYNGIDGEGRSKLSAVDTVSGDVVLDFDPRPNGAVQEVAVTPDGATVFAGGGFSKLGGAMRQRHVGAVDAMDGSARAFDPVIKTDSAVVTLALSPDGSRLFFSTQRNRLFAYDWATAARVWKARANGNPQAIAASTTQVYVGGHWSQLEELSRPFLGALDIDTGDATSWDTRCAGGRMGVWALLIQGSSLHAGGVFSSFGGDQQRGYARFTGTP